LYKAGELLPSEPFKAHARTLVEACDRYSYDAKAGGYLTPINTDGTHSTLKGGTHLVHTWDFAYGGEGIVMRHGRTVAYIASKEKQPGMLAAARRMEQFVHASPRPAEGDIGTLADALNLSMDLYDLTHEQPYLEHSKEYADEIVAKFWRNGLFRSHTGYEYYEAALGVGDAVQGLLRLSLALKPPPNKVGTFDWSF
jgi:hypothetical protein